MELGSDVLLLPVSPVSAVVLLGPVLLWCEGWDWELWWVLDEWADWLCDKLQ